MSTGKGCRRRSLEADYVSVLKALKLYIKICYVKKKKSIHLESIGNPPKQNACNFD